MNLIKMAGGGPGVGCDQPLESLVTSGGSTGIDACLYGI